MRPLGHTLLLAFVPSVLAAQSVSTLRSIGSLAEDRERLAQLTGASTAESLLRDGARVDSATPGLRWLLPEMNFTWNGALATSLNDGALWAGRGANVLTRGGATYGWRRVRLTLAPELAASQNAPVEVLASTMPGRSRWASPWRTAATGQADLPLRFGDASLVTLHTGQSALSAQWDKVAVGISSGNLWWGPGLRNALVLSNQAAGIPHAFVRTPRPLHSRYGDFEGRLIIGGLTESLYFDTIPGNDNRAVSGLALTFAPRRVRGLTVGLARLVIAPVGGAGDVAGHMADALTTWNGGDSRDQLSSLFFRWVAPESGFEFWAEWAKSRLPTLRELLTAPNADQAWTTGLQWALPRDDGALRFQLEFSDLAQSQVFANRAPRDYYTGHAAIQGFTQRGQVLGAASGPGGTNGWLAADRIFDTWSVGGFFARTRWENDAFYRSRLPNSFGHDVSLFSGVRASRRGKAWDTQGALTFERRVNYLFESSFTQPLQRGQRNVSSWRLEFSVAPRRR